MKEINNLAELQDFVEKVATPSERWNYVTLDRPLKKLEVTYWSSEPEFGMNKMWSANLGNEFPHVIIVGTLPLNFKPDFSECIFKIKGEY